MPGEGRPRWAWRARRRREGALQDGGMSRAGARRREPGSARAGAGAAGADRRPGCWGRGGAKQGAGNSRGCSEQRARHGSRGDGEDAWEPRLKVGLCSEAPLHLQRSEPAGARGGKGRASPNGLGRGLLPASPGQRLEVL